jgi:hypothetical protein
MKYCSKCKTDKSYSEYWKNKTTIDGYQSWCKPCWYNKTIEKLSGDTREKYLRMRKNGHLKRKYNITLEEFEIMLKKQNGVCGICKTKTKLKSLAVDHNHTTGQIRGLLCENCNRGLGMFRDNTDFLQQAIKYLEKKDEKTV